jgi:hypothetical protein
MIDKENKKALIKFIFLLNVVVVVVLLLQTHIYII